MSVLRGLLLAVATAGCGVAHGQPRPERRDAGARMDAGATTARRDAGAAARRRDAGPTATRRDAGADVVVLPPTHGRIEPREAQRVLATTLAAMGVPVVVKSGSGNGATLVVPRERVRELLERGLENPLLGTSQVQRTDTRVPR